MSVNVPQITLPRPVWEALRLVAGRIGVQTLATCYLLMGLEEVLLCDNLPPLCRQVIEQALTSRTGREVNRE